MKRTWELKKNQLHDEFGNNKLLEEGWEPFFIEVNSTRDYMYFRRLVRKERSVRWAKLFWQWGWVPLCVLSLIGWVIVLILNFQL